MHYEYIELYIYVSIVIASMERGDLYSIHTIYINEGVICVCCLFIVVGIYANTIFKLHYNNVYY